MTLLVVPIGVLLELLLSDAVNDEKVILTVMTLLGVLNWGIVISLVRRFRIHRSWIFLVLLLTGMSIGVLTPIISGLIDRVPCSEIVVESFFMAIMFTFMAFWLGVILTVLVRVCRRLICFHDSRERERPG